MRTFSGWVYVAFVTDVFSRRIIGWQTTYRPVCTDLAAGALKMAVWQRKRAGADLTCLVHHLPPRRAVQVYSLRGCPGRLRGGRLGGVEGGPPFGFALAEALKLLVQGRAHPLARTWQDIDAARASHHRAGPLVRAPPGHTPPSACAPPPNTKPPGHSTPTGGACPCCLDMLIPAFGLGRAR